MPEKLTFSSANFSQIVAAAGKIEFGEAGDNEAETPLLAGLTTDTALTVQGSYRMAA